MKKLIKDGSYDFLIIPIALINDYCNIVAILLQFMECYWLKRKQEMHGDAFLHFV
ncbi:MAG: hypothetical protein IJO65_12325 [Lachnospiraceae bacterium]|nr:hypothetical protein [Lachnospiraceae bacterium]